MKAVAKLHNTEEENSANKKVCIRLSGYQPPWAVLILRKPFVLETNRLTHIYSKLPWHIVSDNSE